VKLLLRKKISQLDHFASPLFLFVWSQEKVNFFPQVQ